MLKILIDLTKKILRGKNVTHSDALHLSSFTDQKDIVSLISFANIIRSEFKGSNIDTCAIVNAKSGKCPEDCKFCSQSAHHKTNIEKYPLISREKIISKAKAAKEMGAVRFGIITSGRGVKNDDDLNNICSAIKGITQETKIHECASLGVLTKEAALMLKEAGLKRYHHNLETARSFFPEICTTHSYDERLATIKIAKEAGFEVCCGGIFGIGETPEQRLEFAFTLRELEIDSIPMNFLNPIPGTPLENEPQIPPMEILKLIAIYRFILPKADIRICGGRQKNLRNTQGIAYLAGANAVMIGDYLTVPGGDPGEDIQLIKDLMLNPKLT